MPRRQLVLVAIAVTVFTGCADLLAPVPDPTRFYLLAPLPASDAGAVAAMPELALGIGPISLPDYVDRPEMVVRISPTQVRHSIVDQWAEPIGRNVTRVLSENLATLLGTTNITAFPSFEVLRTDYQITVTFLAFEQDAQFRAHLSARWEILHPARKDILLSRSSTLTAPAVGTDIGSGVVALSTALGDLSRQIAEAVRDLPVPDTRPLPRPAGEG